MNTRLIKEGRDLLPAVACMLLLIVVPNVICHGRAEAVGPLVFGLGCLVLGGWSFGNEFQHRTISLLLSQPIERSVLWREKMLVLGAGIIISLAVLAICFLHYWPGFVLQQWPLALVALCAFCGAPYWTLLVRQSIGGMAFAAAVPVGLILVNALVTERLLTNEAVESYSAVALLLIYCALVYGLGYAKFRQLQVVEGDLPRDWLCQPNWRPSLFGR